MGFARCVMLRRRRSIMTTFLVVFEDFFALHTIVRLDSLVIVKKDCCVLPRTCENNFMIAIP